ncbi:unnamed protein product, partial [Ectocarpus sp. 12 AP-2014]
MASPWIIGPEHAAAVQRPHRRTPSPNRETQAETVAFLRRVLLRHSQG